MSGNSNSYSSDHETIENALLACRNDPILKALLKLEWVGPYRIEAFLGKGGMGLVFRAFQEEPIRRRVALKIIKLGLDTGAVVARFESERQALALMDHPNIAKVYDAGASVEGRPYFVMEFVDGMPITEYCEEKRLSIRARLELFRAVCRGVQHAHQKGILHRDLKPSNILVATVDGKPMPKIIDFGIAKATDQQLTERTFCTELGQIVGTPEYMSPEQAGATQDPVDTRTDIYALGAILYELLIGVLPLDFGELEHSRMGEMLERIREEAPARPSTRLAALGQAGAEIAARRGTDVRSLARLCRSDLDWIALKALEKEPARRYASASELEADLGRYLAEEPVSAHRPSTSYRLKKFVRKHRGVVSALAAVACTLVAGIVVSLGLYLEAESERLEVIKVSDLQVFENLRHEAEELLWPGDRDLATRARKWLRKIQALRDRLPLHEDLIKALQERALPTGEAVPEVTLENIHMVQHLEVLRQIASDRTRRPEDSREGEPDEIDGEIGRMKTDLAEQRSRKFADPADQMRFAMHSQLIENLKALDSDDPYMSMVADVKFRLERLFEAEKILSSDEARARWRKATDCIRRSKRYDGLVLKPQHGLLPLGENAAGLWEFVHLYTGEPPRKITENTGLVFVLVPGGTFWMGATRRAEADGEARNLDPHAAADEGPVNKVTLEPFFLSKYEMTQAQWMPFVRKWSGRERMQQNRSFYKPGCSEPGDWSLVHPVEQIQQDEAKLVMLRLGLTLPTEAQWEYAARAGTATIWWAGSDPACLRGRANLANQAYRQQEKLNPDQVESWTDRYPRHAPVGSFPPNRWGFHDMVGNVSEWCLEGYGRYQDPTREGDGLRLTHVIQEQVARGGSFKTRALRARSACRTYTGSCDASVGLRPARAVERD